MHIFIRAFYIFVFVCGLMFIVPSSARAADYSPGDPCSTSGAFHQTNDANGMDFLICDGSNWQSTLYFGSAGGVGMSALTGQPAPSSSAAATALNELSDVNTTGVADGEVLMYSAGASGWVPGAGGGGGGAAISVQVFTANGTWTKPAGIDTIVIEAWGPGGDGSADANGDGGGGGGAYSMELIDVSAITSESVTIGTGGSGTATTFGAHLSAGAGTNADSPDDSGGTGGTASGGDLNLSGGDGGGRIQGNNGGNAGGAAPMGGAGGVLGEGGFDGGDGVAPGGGGGGCETSCTAGNGANGMIIVWEYSSGGGGGGGGGGTPGGSDTHVQFNDGGSTLGGEAQLTWNKTTDKLTVDGDIDYTGVLTDTSDRRLKENITPLENALEGIVALQGYTFTMKGDESGAVEYGLLAQDVQPIFPDLVVTKSDGMMTMNYVGMIAPLVEAVKAQQAQIDAQQEEIDDLRTRLDKLEQRYGTEE